MTEPESVRDVFENGDFDHVRYVEYVEPYVDGASGVALAFCH